MRLNRFFVICVLLAVVSRTFADNLTVEDVSLQAGETRQVGIVLNNTEKMYAAFQFDLVLPAGVTIPKNENGKYLASLNADRASDHTLSVSKKGENTYRFMSFSMSNAAFSGTTGVLVYVTLVADCDFNALAQASVTSQVFTEPSGTQHKLADITFSIGNISNKCATPTITYNKGRLYFTCATPGAQFVSTVNVGQPHIDGYEGDNIELPASLVVTVRAKADGYSDSDVATATLTFSDSGLVGEGLTIEATKDKMGDLNRDNIVDVADIATIISIMAGK